jgi:hypothetical protein
MRVIIAPSYTVVFLWGLFFFMSEVHGVFQLSGKIVALRRDTTYVNILKRHGYVTALVCEMHASLGL